MNSEKQQISEKTEIPPRAQVFATAVEACSRLEIDPSELTQWLIAQGDPGWMTPPAVAWWARHISANGYPEA